MKTILPGAVLCAIFFFQSHAQCAEQATPASDQILASASAAASATVADPVQISVTAGSGLKYSLISAAEDSSPVQASSTSRQTSQSQASDWNWKDHIWLDVNGKSYHFKRAGYNEKNTGLGGQIFTSDHTSILFGHYYNSYRKPTNYLWYNYQPWHWGSTVQVGVIGGMVTGYQKQSVYVPSGIAGLSLTWKPMGEKGFLVNIVTVPGVAIVGNIGFKFW